MSKTIAIVALVALAAVSVNAEATELDANNFDDSISGKSAFVKFFAPWCGHCKRLKPAWDQLADEFSENKDVLIVDVDCTKDVNKDMCGKYGVRGYPTLKYFTGSSDSLGDKYEGGRDFEDLKKFAEDNLGPSCSLENFDLCNDEQKEELNKYKAMTPEEREKLVEEKQDAIEDAETTFKVEVEKLQKKYEKLQKKKDEAIAAASPGLRVIRSVIADLAKAEGNDDKHEEL